MRIRELREEKNLSQVEVAIGIKTSQRNIGRWEKEEVQPAAEYIIKLADFFGVSADYLLGRSDDLGNITINSKTPALSAKERELLALFSQMNEGQKEKMISYAEGTLGKTAGSNTATLRGSTR